MCLQLHISGAKRKGNSLFYRLDENKQPVPCGPGGDGADVWDIKNRRVGLTKIGETEVSTVFLVVDHNPTGDKPVLFETMVFDENDGTKTIRYHTWADAEKGHWECVKHLVDIKNEIEELTDGKPLYDFEEIKKKK